MAPGTNEARLHAMGSHERPIFLQSHFRATAPREDPDASALASTLALAAAGPGPAEGRPARGSGGRKPPRRRAGAGAEPALPSRPSSPTTHLRNMYARAQERIEMRPCDEYHRHFWLPSPVPARQLPLDEDSRKAVDGFGTKQHVWGGAPTDYRQGNWYVENQWSLRSLRRSNSQPSAGASPSDGLGSSADRAKKPWTKSAGVTSSMVGGIGGGLKGRNIGLYEDSFALYKDQYHVPLHGLCSSDVTRMGDAIVQNKAMLRN